MKLLLAKYGSKYTMAAPILKTDGFGFAFPRGSPLVPDVSRAILNVTEGHKMREIEGAWFGIQDSYQDLSTSVSSNRLSLRSFWGLFMIAGIVAILSLITYVAMFVYEHRPSDSKGSIWSKIMYLLSIFDQKDMESHTFKRSDCNGTNPPSSNMELPRSTPLSIYLPEERGTSSGEQSDADSTSTV
ncbi:hypothetical protein JCGZ_07042 [Jatropha curcas]|uniref:Ionotropic glutamate receptor C-terminal domain-containing protein n=2 Tax=Jatropha curcas TaxID=180498 RepID=A0A067KB65_JATCU|nr:hypothetical protein JCGZ_07042 [Jatropha curcas]